MNLTKDTIATYLQWQLSRGFGFYSGTSEVPYGYNTSLITKFVVLESADFKDERAITMLNKIFHALNLTIEEWEICSAEDFTFKEKETVDLVIYFLRSESEQCEVKTFSNQKSEIYVHSLATMLAKPQTKVITWNLMKTFFVLPN